MKRRTFLAAASLLSLFSSSALAQKKPTKKTSKTPPKPKPKAKTPAKPSRSSGTVMLSREVAAEEETPKNAISLSEEKVQEWRNFSLTSTISFRGVATPNRLLVPLLQNRESAWQRSSGHTWQGNFQKAGIYHDPLSGLEVFHAEWTDNVSEARLELASEFATQNRHFDITRRLAPAERGEILRLNLQATKNMPTEGIVREKAEAAIGRIKDPLAQAKALYDWVVDNMIYLPHQSEAAQNIGSVLEAKYPEGNSVTIATALVAMCRAIGIPARPVFGVIIDRSRIFASLGASGNLSRATHCRAEIYSPGYGWVPVDPAGVCKVVQSERLSPQDSKLSVLKKLFFGFWEMNWVALNNAQDLILPIGESRISLPFLQTPVLESKEGKFDVADKGRLELTARISGR